MHTFRPIFAVLAVAIGVVALSAQGPVPAGVQWPPMVITQPASAVLGSGAVVPAQIKFKDGTAVAPSIAFLNQVGFGMFRVSSGIIGFTDGSGGIGGAYSAAEGFKVNTARAFEWSNSSSDASFGVDTQLLRNAAGVVQTNGSLMAGISSTTSAQYRSLQSQAPNCFGANCGTSIPAAVGTDSDMRITMGAAGTPASPFTVSFRGTWAAAPVCQGTMALTGMVAGKAPMLIVTTTGGFTVTTNGTSPSTGDAYAFSCRGVQ